MSYPMNADFLVRGYAGHKHPRAPAGALLLETWHIGEHSKDMEVSVWRARKARGEVSKIEVVHLKPAPNTEEIYP
jgi:hypothetical protein